MEGCCVCWSGLHIPPIPGGALRCARAGTGGMGPSRGAARFKSVGRSGSLLCHPLLAPRWWEDDGAGGMLEAAMGNGPSLFGLQLLSAGSDPNGDRLSLLPCTVLMLGEPPGPLGGEELKSLRMLLPTSPCHLPVLTTPGH